MDEYSLSDRSRLACSARCFSRERANSSFEASRPVSLWNSANACFTSTASRSSPPSRLSPAIALTSKSSRPLADEVDLSCNTVVSRVPPPKSTTSMYICFLSCPCRRPGALRVVLTCETAAATGSGSSLITWKPAIRAASCVACLCVESKYAGTVITMREIATAACFSARARI